MLSAIDRTRCAPTVNAAVRSGVRVIAADSALDSPLISLFIGTDNPESGISAAKALEAQFSRGRRRIRKLHRNSRVQRKNGKYFKKRRGAARILRGTR